MLVLARKIGEAVVMSDGVVVKLLAIDAENGVARLGFEAPQGIRIYRDEKLRPADLAAG
jgi:carbon storage regulator CsrA